MSQIQDFFAEAEKEVTENSIKTSVENKDVSEDKIVDDIWNSDKDIDELFENTVSNPQTEEQQIEEPGEQQTDEPTVQNSLNSDGYSLKLTKPLKYRGKDIYVQSEDELIELAQKGMDYSLKMNKIKPYRNLIDKLENNSISIDDINVFLEAINGNDEAKSRVLDIIGSDGFDNNVNQVTDEQTTNTTDSNSIDAIMNNLYQKDPEQHGKVVKMFNQLDNQFKAEVTENDNVFNNFIGSVLSGEFDEIYPYAVKEKSLNPHMTWIQAYIKGYNVKQNGGYKEQQNPDDALQTDVNVKPKKQHKTIKEQYDEVWDSKQTIEELESMLIDEI